MDERVRNLKSAKDANALAKNALDKGLSDLASAAKQRGLELRAAEDGFSTPVEFEIAVALYVYEAERARLGGRKSYYAGRTRQMLKSRGLRASAERMVLNNKASEGYRVLERAGLREHSFEAIIVRHPGEFSEGALLAAKARLEGREFSVSSSSRRSAPKTSALSKPMLSPTAIDFIENHRQRDSIHMTRWRPRYEAAVREIRESIRRGDKSLAFERIWRTNDNFVSNAGQGLLAFDTVDRLRSKLTEMIADIDADGSTAHFDRLTGTFGEWRDAGLLSKQPTLLLARAFAAIHPERYHTTVDKAKQRDILGWFVSNTGFSYSKSDSWAAQARDLVIHLTQFKEFRDDIFTRNMFPWFVYQQLKRQGQTEIPSLPDSAYANIPAEERKIILRHNQLQTVLLASLQETHGKQCVHREYATGTGGYADIFLILDSGQTWLFEIKVAPTAAFAIRAAIGQLLEYSYWPGGLDPDRMTVVAEPEFDQNAVEFLQVIKGRYGLDIEYRQLVMPEEIGQVHLVEQ